MSKVKDKFIKQNVGTIKIKEITDEYILFTNGSMIEYDHNQDCCEWNYADFSQLEDLAKKTTFTLPLTFQAVDGAGFRFGNPPQKMFFVPCYSEQNGWYTMELNIYFNNRMVAELECADDYVD